MRKNKFSNVLSLIAIVIAIVTFITNCTRLECLPFDTASFLVVVLSVLVTVLLGYQIYNVFAINKRLNENEKEFDKKLNEHKKEFDKKLTTLKKDSEECCEKINDTKQNINKLNELRRADALFLMTISTISDKKIKLNNLKIIKQTYIDKNDNFLLDMVDGQINGLKKPMKTNEKK